MANAQRAETDGGMSEEERRLWSERDAGVDAAAEVLTERYLPYARRIAARLYRSRPDDDVPFEDYLQYANLGLVEAVRRFDAAQGVVFTTFATYRIRGAVLNGVAKATERRDQYEFVRRNRLDRVDSLESETGGDPRQSFREMVDLTVGLALGFLLERSASEGHDRNAPFEALALGDLKRTVAEAVDGLPLRERLVVRSHYFHHVPFENLADQLGLTKGRVSQIHKRALERIRETLAACASLDDYL